MSKILESTTAATPSLIPHTFNGEGFCLEPEVVPIAMPKGCLCELRLAQDAGGGWHAGYRLTTSQGDELDAYPQINSDVKADRSAALLAAANDAQQFFAASPKSRLHKKCAGAVAAFIISLEGSPANKAPANLGARIPEPVNLDVEVEGITPNPHNPRGEISAASVAELAEAIAAVGLLQPVGIRLIPDPNGLPGVGATRRELLWGHRRLEAFRKLKRATIPARVYENISDDQARLLLLIENGQRKDLDPIQEARGYQEMMRDFDLTQDDISKQVKKSRPVIANAIRLLDLPESVQEQLASGALTTAHGTALCRFAAWPVACAKIAELAVTTKASANSLEKNLPFPEELTTAGLVVDFGPSWKTGLDLDAMAKAHKKKPGFFFWHDEGSYSDEGFCLDLAVGQALLAEGLAEIARREAARQQSDDRTESGELTPAAKRERQKKLDGNLTNRLQVTAMQHVALARLGAVKKIDHCALLIVAREAFAHSGYGYADTVAKAIGISLPKNFDNSAERMEVLAKMDPADVLIMAAACLSQRDAENALRNADPLPDYVAMLARPTADESLDAASYVQEWREKILPLVKLGCRAEDVQAKLECPEFIAVQLTREIRRELRDAGVPILTADEAALLEKLGETGVRAMRSEFEIQWDKPNAVLAKIFANTTSAEVAAVRSLVEQEEAWEKSFKVEAAPAEKPKKKTSKKAAPAKKAKKGGKKK